MENKIKIIQYFSGLNALRFFAAFSVVLHHAEQIRMKNGLAHLQQLSMFNNGGLAVTFFFVLSGFLITYLLLKEKHETQTVSVKKFYIRRILRIWPLYFLLVALGTVIVPALIKMIGYNYEMPYQFGEVILYFVFFMPFMVTYLFGHHLLEPLWSIGVEEIFYLVWSPLFKYIRKRILSVIVCVIAIKLLLSIVIFYFELSGTAIYIIGTLSFEAMAIGALGAWLVFNDKINFSTNLLFSKTAQLLCFTCLFLLLFCRHFLLPFTVFKILFNTPALSEYFTMLLFIWLIINISLNKRSIVCLNNKILNYLGEISYGIYMYHMLIVFASMLFLQNTLKNMSLFLSTTIYYTVVIFGVITVSVLSKRYFEGYFLQMKSKFLF
jgi:peptidoglycan/LPS O-acetylase OafA/YrhL